MTLAAVLLYPSPWDLNTIAWSHNYPDFLTQALWTWEEQEKQLSWKQGPCPTFQPLWQLPLYSEQCGLQLAGTGPFPHSYQAAGVLIGCWGRHRMPDMKDAVLTSSHGLGIAVPFLGDCGTLVENHWSKSWKLCALWNSFSYVSLWSCKSILHCNVAMMLFQHHIHFSGFTPRAKVKKMSCLFACSVFVQDLL